MPNHHPSFEAVSNRAAVRGSFAENFPSPSAGALLEGNLFVYPPLNPRLSERSQRLVRAFLTQLPTTKNF